MPAWGGRYHARRLAYSRSPSPSPLPCSDASTDPTPFLHQKGRAAEQRRSAAAAERDVAEAEESRLLAAAIARFWAERRNIERPNNIEKDYYIIVIMKLVSCFECMFGWHAPYHSVRSEAVLWFAGQFVCTF